MEACGLTRAVGDLASPRMSAARFAQFVALVSECPKAEPPRPLNCTLVSIGECIDKIVERFEREAGVPGFVSMLAEHLPPTDLQSILLEVYRIRSE